MNDKNMWDDEREDVRKVWRSVVALMIYAFFFGMMTNAQFCGPVPR